MLQSKQGDMKYTWVTRNWRRPGIGDFTVYVPLGQAYIVLAGMSLKIEHWFFCVTMLRLLEVVIFNSMYCVTCVYIWAY